MSSCQATVGTRIPGRGREDLRQGVCLSSLRNYYGLGGAFDLDVIRSRLDLEFVIDQSLQRLVRTPCQYLCSAVLANLGWRRTNALLISSLLQLDLVMSLVDLRQLEARKGSVMLCWLAFMLKQDKDVFGSWHLTVLCRRTTGHSDILLSDNSSV